MSHSVVEMQQLRGFFTTNENCWFSGCRTFAGTILYKYIAYNSYYTILYRIITYAYGMHSFGNMSKKKTVSHNPITPKVPKGILLIDRASMQVCKIIRVYCLII